MTHDAGRDGIRAREGDMLRHAFRRCARATTRGAMTSSAARTRGIASSSAVGDEFRYEPLFDVRAPKDVEWRLVTTEGVSETRGPDGEAYVKVEPSALRALAARAVRDVSHLLRPGHLQQLRKILDDPEASKNDRFVALELLKNACVAAGMILPGCQDTGTAIVMGKRGGRVLTDGEDEAALSRGVYDTRRRIPVATYRRRSICSRPRVMSITFSL